MVRHSIRVLTTGGSMDKDYCGKASDFVVGEPALPGILRDANAQHTLVVQELARKDSLALTDEDREHIREAVEGSKEDKIVITHGTDTMVQTAIAIESAALRLSKTVVLCGAMQPAAFKNTDAAFNVGFAFSSVQLLQPGAHVVMNGEIFSDPSKIYKEGNIFYEVTKQNLNDKLKEILSATPLTFKMPMQTLDENCNPALARCVEKMAEHPECGVRILCTTENPAGIWESAKLCKDLALFRAHAVKQALVLQGATNVITCVGAGANGACTCIIEEVDIEEVDIEEQKLSCAHLVFKNPETNADMEVLFEKRPLGFEFNRTAPITISKVEAGSHGEEKGVKEGWIIERINDTSFTNESNFQAVYDILMKAVKGLSDGHVKI